MGVDPAALALGQAPAHVRTEQVDGGTALLRCRAAGQVHLEVGLAQPLTGPVGERGDTVGLHAEQRTDLRRFCPLDLGVPQHRLPAFGQRQERSRDQGAFQALQSRIHEGLARGDALHVLGRHLSLVAAPAIVGRVAHGGEQVGAERVGGAAAALDHAEHTGEGLGHGVIDLGVAPQELSGQSAPCGRMPFVQNRVGPGVSVAYLSDQLSVTDERLCVVASGVGHPTSFLRGSPPQTGGRAVGTGRGGPCTTFSEKYPASAS